VSSSAPHPRNFLIVDDDPIIISLLEQMLLMRGAKNVYTAPDGGKAIAILSDSSKPVDVMTLDLNMPNMDGVSFLSRAADIGYKGGIFLISGESTAIVNSARQLARMLGLNCLGTFGKPIDFDDVVDSVILAMAENKSRPQMTSLTLDEGHVAGAEALARMFRDDGSIMHAGEMIKIAEDNGMIKEVTWQMAKSIVTDYHKMRQFLASDFKLSFNISTDLLADAVFSERITYLVRNSGLDPAAFVLEVTESKIPSDVSVALQGLARLRMQGFGLSIDDFGTGFSNMETLRLFPFTELKVDQQFMLNARDDAFAWACVDSSVRLAKQLNLNIVAEGIETEFEHSLAKAHAIDEMQGYLFARPMPLDQFIEFVKLNQKDTAKQKLVRAG